MTPLLYIFFPCALFYIRRYEVSPAGCEGSRDGMHTLHVVWIDGVFIITLLRETKVPHCRFK